MLAQGYVLEGPEPNDFTGVPTPAGCGMRITGALTPGDSDYYAVVVAAPGMLKAYTSYGKASPLAVDTIVDIKDATDLLLASDDDGGAGLWSYAGCNIVAPGLYFVVVKGFAAATFGPYTLDIMCEGPVVVEGPEPNNDPLLFGAPTPGGCGLLHHGEIFPAGDSDWWGFVHGGGSVTITTGPGGAGGGLALYDSMISVYTAASVLIVPVDDDGGEAYYSSISAVLPAGLYYVNVVGFGAATGFYSLRIGCGEPASVIADVSYPAVPPPGCVGALVYRASGPGGVRVRPRLNTTFSVDASGLPPLGLVAHVIGLSLPPPLLLVPFGSPPGCFLSVATDAVLIAFADPLGESPCSLFIPNVPIFSGFALHFQTATLGPLGTTNVVSSVIGNIGFP